MNNRFEVIKSELLNFKEPNASYDRSGAIKVLLLRDKQTGVIYLVNHLLNSGGITPLIDKDGKPITTL